MSALQCQSRFRWIALFWIVVWVALLFAIFPVSAGSGPVQPPAQHGGFLDQATSPYLLSHKDDAIQWRPWSEETLALARKSQKPIFLSIGYAACHWCHVMARKTFVDERIIAALNQNFFPILVDQEERPDIASHFFEIMAAMTGRSGSPANFLLTPALTPVFAAGYMGPDREYGSPGLVEILTLFRKDWHENRDQMQTSAAQLYQELLQERDARFGPTPEAGKDPAAKAAGAWFRAFDAKYGGFGQQPKFPSANVLSFLVRHASFRGDGVLLDKVFLTLDHMAAGGLRDQIGGAFHRYAVDRYWQVPHFEIMLHENALLAALYIDAWKVAGDPSRKEMYAFVARGILHDLEQRFRLNDGAFAASLDAETAEGEGGFYTWSAGEIRAVIEPRKQPEFMAVFVDQKYGLVKGRSVLRLRHGQGPQAFNQLQARHRASFRKLERARSRRPAPKRDEKVITSWNAITISAFAKAAQVFGDPHYMEIALAAMKTLAPSSGDDSGVTHSRLGRRSLQMAFLEDYAFLIEACLDLYETGFDRVWLDKARRLARDMVDRFQSAPGERFQMTPVGRASPLPVQYPISENAIPSANAAAVSGLLRLGLFDPVGTFHKTAMDIVEKLGAYLMQSGSQASGFLQAMAFSPRRSHELIIVGEVNDRPTQAMLAESRQRLLSGIVTAVIPKTPDDAANGKSLQADGEWLLLNPRPQIDGRVTAYLCQQQICKLPVNTPEQLARQLDDIVSNGRQLTRQPESSTAIR